MNDIKLLEKCILCESHITLMESINTDNGRLMLVKRCLNCGNYPSEEVVELKPIESEGE